jgi:hypothetical protein
LIFNAGVENINSLGLNDILISLEFKENDAILEQYCLRDIILSIDQTQSRIITLQNHLIKASNTVDRSQNTKKSQKKKNLDSFLQNDAGWSHSVVSLVFFNKYTFADYII